MDPLFVLMDRDSIPRVGLNPTRVEIIGIKRSGHLDLRISRRTPPRLLYIHVSSYPARWQITEHAGELRNSHRRLGAVDQAPASRSNRSARSVAICGVGSGWPQAINGEPIREANPCDPTVRRGRGRHRANPALSQTSRGKEGASGSDFGRVSGCYRSHGSGTGGCLRNPCRSVVAIAAVRGLGVWTANHGATVSYNSRRSDGTGRILLPGRKTERQRIRLVSAIQRNNGISASDSRQSVSAAVAIRPLQELVTQSVSQDSRCQRDLCATRIVHGVPPHSAIDGELHAFRRTGCYRSPRTLTPEANRLLHRSSRLSARTVCSNHARAAASITPPAFCRSVATPLSGAPSPDGRVGFFLISERAVR